MGWRFNPFTGGLDQVGGGGGAVWGGITGTLTDQADLVTALGLKANLAGATFTGQVVFEAASATGSINISPTWNDAGTAFSAIYGRVTNTASAGTSTLIDLGTAALGSIFTISKNGELVLISPSDGGSGMSIFRANTNTWAIGRGDQAGGTQAMQWVTNNLNIAVGGSLSLGTTYASRDLFLVRKAAATLQFGEDAAGVTNQMLTAANRITSDGVGANLTIAPGNGRGGAGGSLILSTFTTGGAGVAGTLTPRLYVNGPDGLLQFGAQDNTAPALKRNSSTLECKLADDSGEADFRAAIISGNGFRAGGNDGVTAGPFTTITSITVVGGIVTDLQGS